MSEVERLLTASVITIGPIDPAHPDAQHCLREYFAELVRRFEGGFDPALSLSPDTDEFRPPRGLLLVVSLRSEPVGCGALKFREGVPTEIKRMWVASSARGLGIGRRLLGTLEALAVERARGACLVRLETNKALAEAIRLYRSTGYVEIEAFNDERYGHHWFQKQLPAPALP